MKSIYVTTSWDDGAKQDVKLAKILDKYGLKGTFYNSLNSSAYDLLDRGNVFSIAERHEIGAHGVTHCDLTKLPDEEVKGEVLRSKNIWEKMLNKEVDMFAYPYGRYNKRVVNIVRSAGFKGARILRWLCMDMPKDPYQIAPSANVYPHSRIINIAHLIKNKDFQALNRHLFKDRLSNKWDRIAMNIFDYVNKRGGVWHLWGHSWEIDKLGLWGELEAICEYASRREGVKYCTNGELIDRLFGMA